MNDESGENEKIVLDLSRKRLKKVPKQYDAQNVRTLILDENELQKIDNIDSYLKIEKLSLCKNQLLRMYGVCRLHCLRELNLSFNGILSIEGLKDCIHLRYLNLEGNNIKTIEHLTTNVNLSYLNLAENSIGSISDISYLKSLKELYLHGNRLTHLRQCDKYLPLSIEILTLAKNNLSDLNEICSLAHLNNLTSITIAENPCVSVTAGPDGFDYRPFVLNWCMSLKLIDNYAVDPIESLKAEWLYSQGRGRNFRLGEQVGLAKYLSSVCPLIGKALENENERKLRLILSKAQHHQRQLQEEISENTNTSLSSSPSSGRKKPASRIQSPRFSRLSGRQSSTDSMINSYHGNTTNEQTNNASATESMTISLIESSRNNDICHIVDNATTTITTVNQAKINNASESMTRSLVTNSYSNYSDQQQPQQQVQSQQIFSNNSAMMTGGPLVAASKMLPVPETLMSPDICPTTIAQRATVTALNSQLHQQQHLHHNNNQQQSSKTYKDKENHLNSPKMRSPQLKRQSERSPVSCQRKIGTSVSTIKIMNDPSTDQQHQQIHCRQQQRRDPLPKKLRSYSTNATHVSNFNDTQSGEGSSDDDSDHINIEKLKTIRNKAAQKCQQMKNEMSNSCTALGCNPKTESSAVVIQKIWRGYRTRKKTKDIAEKLLRKRTYEYIDKLAKDMEMTKSQLENERKIQQLQMQAINALWKRVSTIQNVKTGTNDKLDCNHSEKTTAITANTTDTTITTSSAVSGCTFGLDQNCSTIVNDLTKTCSLLTNQVQQLQGSMRDILNCLTLFCNLPQESVKRLLTTSATEALSCYDHVSDNKVPDCVVATQTEISAVHTPQIENFPFNRIRPSTLPVMNEFENQDAAKQLLNTIDSNNCSNSNAEDVHSTKHLDQPIQSPQSLNQQMSAVFDESGIISGDLTSTGESELLSRESHLNENLSTITPTNTAISTPTTTSIIG